MNIWDVLETEPTKDKDALKRAYRKKLMKTNPEDDPEGFQSLREAYEEALKRADSEEQEGEMAEEGTSTVSQRLSSIYSNLETRMDERVWEELLQEEYFLSPDTSDEGLFELLKFIGEHFRLSSGVYRIISQAYNLPERRRELSEQVPADLLRFIIQKANSEETLDYKAIHILDGTDPDVILGKLEKIERKIRENNAKEAEPILSELLEKMEAGTLECPPAKVYEIRYYQQTGEEEKACEMARLLYEQYPENADVLIVYADTRLELGDPKELLEIYEKVLKMRPESVLVKTRCAEVFHLMGEFEKARDRYFDMLKKDPYNNYVRENAIRACEEIIRTKGEKREALIKERESTGEEASVEEKNLVIDIAIAQYQSYRFDEAIESLFSITPEGERTADYYAYIGRSYLAKEDAEHALPYLISWKETLEKMPEENLSETETKLKKRYPYVLYLIGSAYMLMREGIEARTYMDRAEKYRFDEKIALLEGKIELEYRTDHYKDCIEACERLEAEYPGNYVAFLFRAKAFYRLGLYQEAVNYANEAAMLYPYIVDPHYIMMKIFYRNKQYEDEERIIREYESFGFDSVTVKMEKARLLFRRDNKPKEAYELIQEYAYEENNDLEEPEEFYLLLGELHEALLRPKEAEQAYLQAEKLNSSMSKLNLKIGLLYKKMGRTKEAKERFSDELMYEHDPVAFLMRGECYSQMRCFAKARQDAKYAVRIAPRTVSFYVTAADLLARTRDYQSAYNIYLEAYDMAGDEKLKSNILTDLIRCEIHMQMYRHAEDHLEELTSKRGYSRFVTECLFEMDILRGHLDKARERLIKSSWGKSKVPETRQKYYDKMMEVFCRKGDLKEAEDLLKNVKKNHNDSSKQYILLGRLYSSMKKYAKAEEMFQCAAEKDDTRKILILGFMAEAAGHQLGGTSRKKRYLRQAENMEPSDSLAPFEYELAMARIERLQGNLEEALSNTQCYFADLEGCTDRDEVIVDLIVEQGLCYVDRGEVKDGLRLLEGALRDGGENAEIRHRIEEIRKEHKVKKEVTE